MEDFSEFQKIIGYQFKDICNLKTALTHSSFVNELKDGKGDISDNERYEFFGDAILEFFVSDYLFKKYKNSQEGDLTKIRASMVCEQSLFLCAKEIRLGEFLIMGKGENASGGRGRASILSDAFEALTAAIYIDSGEAEVKKFLEEHFLKVLDNRQLFFDAKTKLQEVIQKKNDSVLEYVLVSESGPSHNKTFVMTAVLNGKEIGRGTGRSKKLAQQDAAVSALKYLKGPDKNE